MSLKEDDALPSDSESDDEDYVPAGANDALSEEESGNESNDYGDSGDEVQGKRKKPLRRPRKSRKKTKTIEEKENEKEKVQEELTFEDKKKRASALWEDFMKDVGPPVKKKPIETATKFEPAVETNKEALKPDQPPEKVKVKELFEFAGEKVEVEREITPAASESSAVTTSSRSKGGIAGILGQLGKRGKLSTLEKSKLDWDKFKKQEGIDEELDSFNKGKNGYLEKQDFLQRADLRQFEIEKEMRNKKRSLNR